MQILNNIRKLVRSKTSKKSQISLGGMPFEESSLFTNILTFGAIGSGKTAAVIYPLLDAITAKYNNPNSAAPDANYGGFILDVKGDFHEALIYLMQKHGRDVLADLVVIRPDNDYYFLEFEDIKTGRRFFVSCIGGLSSQECNTVLATAQGPEGSLKSDECGQKRLVLPSGETERLAAYLFSEQGLFLQPAIATMLSQLTFDVTGKVIRWLGWRSHETGKLVRISGTSNKEAKVVYAADGTPILTEHPTELRYIGVHALNSGLTYNLVSKDVASSEAAGRIMAVAEVTGNSMGGDNAYWSNATEKHVAACIELFRQVEGPNGKECSIAEIQQFTTNDTYLQGYLNHLSNVVLQKQLEGVSEYEILILRNLNDYFVSEWLHLDPKTKGNIMSCVTNLLGDVTRNKQLVKTFCSPSKFSFKDCMNEGKVCTLVLSAFPNAQMLIGTSMKLDFQQEVLRRTQAVDINKHRFLLFLADEYQYFLTTTGGWRSGADEKFLSVSRQTRTCNIISAQAKSSLLAVQRDEAKIDAFIQCFGSRVFLQNLDEKTNRLAEMTLGEFWEKQTGSNLRAAFIGMDHGDEAAVTEFIRKFGSRILLTQVNPTSLIRENITLEQAWEKRRNYEDLRPPENCVEPTRKVDSSFFTQLPPFKAVIFNKERPTGKKIVQSDLRDEAKFWNRDLLAGAANEYYRGYIENRANSLGIAALFDTQPAVQLTSKEPGALKTWKGGTK